MSSEGKRLNLGCGDFAIPGFINVDLMPPADVIGDFTTMSFDDVDEVVMSHVLEHLSWQRTAEILALVRSWMNGGGRITVEVPDMAAVMARGIYDRYAEIAIYGIQSDEGEFHRAGFTLNSLAAKMETAQFFVASGRSFVSDHPARPGFPCVEVIGEAM